jgi:pimeloyl-ACP methyl ester carboxylesterase
MVAPGRRGAQDSSPARSNGGTAMAFVKANGVRLFYEQKGAGTPLVLVHGSWVSHASWNAVVPTLSTSFRVLTYDRRGHSESERLRAQGSVHEDVADLGALIEEIGLAPAWVAGNSFGASIALRFAAKRPDLLRGVMAHEPPLFALLADEKERAPLLAETGRRIAAVVELIRAGDSAGAAEQFAETVAVGPGSWAQFTRELQQTWITNAPTFLDETGDPEALAFDLAWLKGLSLPCLLSCGDQSPPTFAPVIAKLAKAAPKAQVVTLRGAGHIPHATHTEAYVEMVTSFIRSNGG